MNRSKVLALFVLVVITVGIRPAYGHERHPPARATVEDLLALQVRPFAIAHRGFGDNLGEDPSRPIENTVAAVRRGFLAGASVVEVDVQLTRDGKVAVFHDDFLPDFTCLNQLSLRELQERLPFVPTLEAVLEQARRLNQPAGPLRGLVIIELKAAAPLCDPHDRQDRAIVAAVSRVVHRAGMAPQVMFTSFSPALLSLAGDHAPQIVRILSLSGLQFLSAAEVEAFFGYPVTPINKKLDLGLQWAEIGPLFRLPGYGSVDEALAIALTVQARVVEADLFFLQSAGAPFVSAVQGFGLKALGFTATNPAEWAFLESLGLDGIYANDVPYGVAHQASIP
jgi:glycerophosphoryl diester phosphodiesterase